MTHGNNASGRAGVNVRVDMPGKQQLGWSTTKSARAYGFKHLSRLVGVFGITLQASDGLLEHFNLFVSRRELLLHHLDQPLSGTLCVCVCMYVCTYARMYVYVCIHRERGG